MEKEKIRFKITYVQGTHPKYNYRVVKATDYEIGPGGALILFNTVMKKPQYVISFGPQVWADIEVLDGNSGSEREGIK